MADVSQAQILSLAAGIQASMDALQTRIEDRILAEAMPLVGSGMATAAAAGEVALNATTTLGLELANALDALSGAASQTKAAVAAALEAALGAAGFGGTAVTVTVVGGVARITVATQKFGEYVQDMAGDLALAGLDAAASATGTIGATFDYALEFGTDASGFFFDTSGGEEVTLSVTLDNLDIDPTLTLGGQDYVAVDAGSTFAGTIGINVQAAGGEATVAQMATVGLVGTLDGSADINVELTVAPGGDMTPPITANLLVGWDFNGATVNPNNNNANFGDRPTVTFDTVTMDLGAFMGDFITPLIEQVNALLDPIRPVLEIMTASIAVLEDFPGLGNILDATGDGRVTLLDILALKFPEADIASFEEFADIALQIADWADFLTGQAFAGGALNLGSFDLGTADIRLPGFDLATAVGDFQGLADDLNSVVGSLTGTGWATVDPGTGMSGREILQSMLGDGIFNLPILTDPAQWMNLFLGEVTDLVTVDMPTVSFDTGTETILSFPIFPLVNFEVTAGFAAHFDFDFGFDTRGLMTPGLSAIDGLYMIDGPGAEIMLMATMGLGIAAGISGVLEATAEGNMEGTILLDLRDQLQQAELGHLYFDEFFNAMATNPFSVFDASGSITVGFSAVIDSLLGEIWHYDSPRVTLGDFGFDNADEPDLNLARKNGQTLTLNIGDRSVNRNPVVNIFQPETEFMSVSTVAGTGETLLVLKGFRETFANITKIVGDAKHGQDYFTIGETLEIAVDFSGGTENDVLQGAALADTLEGNADDDALFGRGGNDSLLGGNNDDFLDGGTGADTLDGGSGVDRVSYLGSLAGIVIDLAAASQSGGDAEGDVLIGIEIIDGTDLADSIKGSLGDGIVLGMLGHDTLTSGSHDQALFGNAGNDLLEGGGHDTLAGGMGDDVYVVRSVNVVINENEIEEIEAGSDSGYDWVQAYASVDVSNNDFIEKITLKGKAADAVANAADNLVQGNASANELTGLDGADTIYGNGGDDTIYGGNGVGLLYGGLGNDNIYGGTSNDSIYGGTGADMLVGDQGADLIEGAADADVLLGDLGADSLYGGDSGDTLNGGGDNDLIDAGTGFDSLSGGTGDDTMFGGSGNDYLIGNAGADEMTGGLDGDYYQADGDDTIFEDVAGGIDYVFATEDIALDVGQQVEILSLHDLNGAQWLAPWFEPFGIVRAEGYYLLSRSQGTASPNRASDLTGNEIDQILIADLSDVEHNVVNHLEGMAGADTIIGDNQMDFAVYLQSDQAVQIDLNFAEQHGGHAEADYFYGIHHLIGSAFADKLTAEDFALVGYEFDNEFDGAGGNDLIYGFGGRDTLSGGDGKDTIHGGSGGVELYGGNGLDKLYSGSGSDTLDGGAGIDLLDGGNGGDTYVVTLGDLLVDAGGTDTVNATQTYFLQAGVEIEVLQAEEAAVPLNIALYGNAFAQEIIGNSADNFIHGGEGADTIRGGAGYDMASYLLSGAGVDVDLNRNTQSGGAAQGDEIIGIEALQGSTHDDILIGRATEGSATNYDDEHFGLEGNDRIEDTLGENTLHGGLGDDTLVGSGTLPAIWGQGSLLTGGDGNDSLSGGVTSLNGGDTLVGGLGDDTYHVTSAGDVVDENALAEIGVGHRRRP